MKHGGGPSLADKPDYLVCTCMGVMYSEICQAIAQGAQDLDALSDLLAAGTGCTSCTSEVSLILDEQLTKK